MPTRVALRAPHLFGRLPQRRMAPPVFQLYVPLLSSRAVLQRRMLVAEYSIESMLRQIGADRK